VKRLRHLLQYGGYRLLAGTLRRLPHAWARPSGRLAGRLVAQLAGELRRIADHNLDTALPELSERQRRSLGRECFVSLGGAVFDTLSATRFTPEELEQWVAVEGWHHFEAAERQGRGLFLMGAHFGSFEIGVYTLSRMAAPLHVVSAHLSNPRFDRELRRLRHRFGSKILLGRKGAARLMYQAIRANGRVLIAMDLRTRSQDAIAVPFFGRPSLTSPIPAFIALKRGTPVVPVFMYRTPNGYRLEVEPAIAPRGSGRRGVAETTELYLAALERRIRRSPEMWVWMYRRWRPEWDDPRRIGSSLAIKAGEEA
jgi:KDO2-lipid IV(A) lauroyltransferase